MNDEKVSPTSDTKLEEKIVKDCFSEIKSDLKWLMTTRTLETQSTQIVKEAIDTIAVITLMLEDMDIDKNIQQKVQQRVNERNKESGRF